MEQVKLATTYGLHTETETKYEPTQMFRKMEETVNVTIDDQLFIGVINYVLGMVEVKKSDDYTETHFYYNNALGKDVKNIDAKIKYYESLVKALKFFKNYTKEDN